MGWLKRLFRPRPRVIRHSRYYVNGRPVTSAEAKEFEEIFREVDEVFKRVDRLFNKR